MYGSKSKTPTHVLYALFAVIAFLLGNQAVTVYLDAVENTTEMLEIASIVLEQSMSLPLRLSVAREALLGGLVGVGVVAMLWLYFVFAAEQTRPGEEHGTARWGTMAEASRYANHKNPDRNIILSKNIRMTMDRPRDLDYDRNLNVLVIGGSGSGKTAFILTPNALQYQDSYVFTTRSPLCCPSWGRAFWTTAIGC